jgi:chromatin remodeling complex protein RSC6
MGKKVVKKTTTDDVEATPVVETVVETPPPVVVEEAAPKKKRVSKKKAVVEEPTPVEAVPVVEEPVVAVSTEEPVVDAAVAPVRRKRRTIKKEDLAKDLDGLTRDLFENISNKDLTKRIKQFRSDIIKILKLKNLTEKKERDISNSGFMKPVKVSEKMRVFLALQPEELTRRLDITKRLCEYIKVNDLQDPKDRRNIIPDQVLGELLNMTAEDGNLTYYSIQQKLKDHIIKV